MNHSIIPSSLDDVLVYKNEIETIEKWIQNYKKDHTECKKALLIIGNVGSGKTLLAELLLKKYSYQKIELNSSDFRSQKKLSEFLIKTLCFKNVVDMFFEEKKPIGLLMDEIDTMNNDKGGLKEFIQILKDDEKCTKELLNNKKSKTKSKKKDYIDLYNPIICTSLNIYDKKIIDLKKYCEVVYLKKISINDLILLMDHYFKDISYEKNLIKLIYNFIDGDIRKLNNILENLITYKEKKKITVSDFNNLKIFLEKKNNDVQLIDATYNILYQKIDFSDSLFYYQLEPYFLPFMIYHNLEKFIDRTNLTILQKFNLYKKILTSICNFDIIQNLSFETYEWGDFVDLLSFYGIYNINFCIFNQYPNINTKDFSIEFTNIMNKMSQLLVNKKIVNIARHSFKKTYVETNDILYLSEIFFYYFHDFKQLYNSKEETTTKTKLICSDSDDKKKKKKKEKKNDSIQDISIQKKNEELIEISNEIFNENDSENDNEISNENDNEISNINFNLNSNLNNNKINHELLIFMNKNKMDINDLENILKLEKFNKIDVKIKKNLNVSLVKKIEENLFY